MESLCAIITPYLNNDQIIFAKKIYVKRIYTMKNIRNNKSCGNYWLTKGFYEVCWGKLKVLFIASVTETKENQAFHKGKE